MNILLSCSYYLQDIYIGQKLFDTNNDIRSYLLITCRYCVATSREGLLNDI